MSKEQFKNLEAIYQHPVGRDVLDKIALILGVSPKLLLNPVTRRIPLSALKKLTDLKAPGLIDTLVELLQMNPDRLTESGSSGERAWWRDAVFYQIYPRSFADSNGDGIGDLQGIIGKLDYLENLGVDCLWLSPIFDSPNEDMGYDVRDYRAVMDLMGTMDDLDELVEKVHAKGMRIILDLVVNHSSEQHEWFQETLRDPEGDKAGYYILREGNPDEPPNNWISLFSGSAWRWFDDIERWGLHLFAPGQMDLNWDNPALRAEVADIVQFWLAKGIDGFRLDVINFISKADGLPDGNPLVGEMLKFTGIEHYFIGPHLHEYLRELRANGFTREDGSTAFMVGETPGIGIEVGRLLSHESRKELDLYFNFDVMESPGKTKWDDYQYEPAYFLDFYLNYLGRIDAGDQMALVCENHDNPRIVSKISTDPKLRAPIAKLIGAIQLTLPGTPFIYQGQELGAVNQDFRDVSELQDIESINYYAELIEAGMNEADAWARIMAGSRDHARVPMRWTPDGGFGSGEPWLKGTDTAVGFSAEEQTENPDSIFNFYRQLLSLRKEFSASGFSLLARDGAYASWRRGKYLFEVNLEARTLDRPKKLRGLPGTVVLSGGEISEDDDRFGPYAVKVTRLGG